MNITLSKSQLSADSQQMSTQHLEERSSYFHSKYSADIQFLLYPLMITILFGLFQWFVLSLRLFSCEIKISNSLATYWKSCTICLIRYCISSSSLIFLLSLAKKPQHFALLANKWTLEKQWICSAINLQIQLTTNGCQCCLLKRPSILWQLPLRKKQRHFFHICSSVLEKQVKLFLTMKHWEEGSW